MDTRQIIVFMVLLLSIVFTEDTFARPQSPVQEEKNGKDNDSSEEVDEQKNRFIMPQGINASDFARARPPVPWGPLPLGGPGAYDRNFSQMAMQGALHQQFTARLNKEGLNTTEGPVSANAERQAWAPNPGWGPVVPSLSTREVAPENTTVSLPSAKVSAQKTVAPESKEEEKPDIPRAPERPSVNPAELAGKLLSGSPSEIEASSTTTPTTNQGETSTLSRGLLKSKPEAIVTPPEEQPESSRTKDESKVAGAQPEAHPTIPYIAQAAPIIPVEAITPVEHLVLDMDFAQKLLSEKDLMDTFARRYDLPPFKKLNNVELESEAPTDQFDAQAQVSSEALPKAQPEDQSEAKPEALPKAQPETQPEARPRQSQIPEDVLEPNQEPSLNPELDGERKSELEETTELSDGRRDDDSENFSITEDFPTQSLPEDVPDDGQSDFADYY